MLYYTVHGYDDNPTWDDGSPVGSVADDFGLSERLGFRPRWCSGLYEDSLADSWFSIWAASPLFIEAISFIESDEAVPIDALAWTKLRLKYMDLPAGQPGWLEEFEAIFDVEGVPRWRLEYLVPDSPDETVTIPSTVVTHALNFDAAERFARIYNGPKEFEAALDEGFKRIYECGNRQAVSQGMRTPLGMENAYRLFVQGSGIPSLLWALGFKRGLNPGLGCLTLEDLAPRPGCAYDKAQQLRLKWDKDAEGFSESDFDEMHRLFLKAIDEAAYDGCMRDMADVGRNELCPCGSGKKYKKCHGMPHSVDWYVGLE